MALWRARNVRGGSIYLVFNLKYCVKNNKAMCIIMSNCSNQFYKATFGLAVLLL